MSNKLQWVNSNTVAATVAIFRSTDYDPNYQTTFTTPIATLPGNTTTYTDTTAVLGVEYYYAIKTSIGAQSAWTPLTKFNTSKSRGPGPNVLRYGDERLGYYGPVGSLELPEFLAALSPDPLIYDYAMRNGFHKFIRKNKILFVASWNLSAITTGYLATTQKTVMDLYGVDNGIVWGFDTSGWGAGYGKNTKFTKNGWTYYLRSPRGFPDNWDGVNMDMAQALNPRTEFNEIIQCMNPDSWMENKLGNFVPYDTSGQRRAGGIACAERTAANRTLTRGTRSVTSGTYQNSVLLDSAPSTMLSSNSSDPSSSTDSAFYPIFELIEA